MAGGEDTDSNQFVVVTADLSLNLRADPRQCRSRTNKSSPSSKRHGNKNTAAPTTAFR
jgi:hypothetical protein